MATFDTWGGAWGTSWAETWFRSSLAQQIGGGGGGPLDMGEESPPLPRIIEEREPRDRFRSNRERQARLREQLRVALEGPQAEEVRAYVESRPSDSSQPLHERVEIVALSDKQIGRIGEFYRAALEHNERLKREAREREIAEDDEDVMMLL